MPQFQRSRLVSDLIIRKEWRQVLGELAMVLLTLAFGEVLDLRFSRKRQSRQLKNDGDLKRAGDNVPEELERIEL
jgi:hypothetical protein